METYSGDFICPKCGKNNIWDFKKWQNKDDKWILYHENGWFSTKTFKIKKDYEWSSDNAYSFAAGDHDMDDWNRYMDEGYKYRKLAEAVAESDIDCWKNTQGSTLTEWNSIDKRRNSYDKKETSRYWFCLNCGFKSDSMLDFIPQNLSKK